MSKLIKIFLPVIFWSIFAYVLLKVDYPDNPTTASAFQILSFFLPLLLALTFSLNIFLRLSPSLLLSSGLIILLALKALDSLNFVSASLTIIAILLLLSYFKKHGREIREIGGIRRIRRIRGRNKV